MLIRFENLLTGFPIIHLYISVSISLAALLLCLSCFCPSWFCFCCLLSAWWCLCCLFCVAFCISFSGSLTMTQQPLNAAETPVKWQNRLNRAAQVCRLKENSLCGCKLSLVIRQNADYLTLQRELKNVVLRGVLKSLLQGWFNVSL